MQISKLVYEVTGSEEKIESEDCEPYELSVGKLFSKVIEKFKGIIPAGRVMCYTPCDKIE